LRAEVRQHLATFRKEAAKLRLETCPLFLPLALVEPYLDALALPGHRPLQDIAELNPAARLWRIARAHYAGVI
ncbi:MAG: squalene synthase, partial [Chitinophagales bacterium]|nr:squalene synthase [Hyphomicrobiales bacterium]